MSIDKILFGFMCHVAPTQLAFTCSKSTIEILGKDVKYVKINNKNTRTTSFTDKINKTVSCFVNPNAFLILH